VGGFVIGFGVAGPGFGVLAFLFKHDIAAIGPLTMARVEIRDFIIPSKGL